MSTRLLTLYVEIVKDRRSAWQPVRVGRTWATRPARHDGRLLELNILLPTQSATGARFAVAVRIPRDLLDDPPALKLELELVVPPAAEPIANVSGSVEALQ